MNDKALREFTYNYYREALRQARLANYHFIGYDEREDTRETICLLRHDCDNDLYAALRMAEIESEEAVRATYFILLSAPMYNAMSEQSREIIGRIISFGHDIALHFDEGMYAKCDDERVRDEIEKERTLLHRICGNNINAVSFHRPSARVLENRLEIPAVNTYDKKDMAGFDYLSDSSGIMRADLPKMFATRYFSKLQLNIHPEWWSEEEADVLGRWKHMIQNNVDGMQHDLWQKEPAFPQLFSLTLDPTGPYRELPHEKVYVKHIV